MLDKRVLECRADARHIMKDHRPKLDVPGVGNWTLDTNTGEIEFMGEAAYFSGLHGALQKVLSVPNRGLFVDPQKRFIIVEAIDELLYGAADTGQLTTAATLNRIDNRGLRFGKFIQYPTAIFIYERGIVVFDGAGRHLWARHEMQLDDHFKKIADGRIVYTSEREGQWGFDILTGNSRELD
jgi:hypothetical protein